MSNRRFGGGGMSRMGGSGSMSRMGGGGGMSRMGSSGGFNQFGGNKPSPWQGGANPGPNPALAGAQAQLAIAITNLLQNQQSGNPPPLLSLNTSSGYQGGPPIRPGPRFQGRGDMMRPFGKNRLGGPSPGWRNDNTFKNRNNQGNFRQGGFKKKFVPKAISKDSKPITKPAVKKENKDESRDEEKETKRDWKEEKKNDTTEEPVEQTEQDSEANKPKKETPKVSQEGRYTGVKTNLLQCFVCGKTMWDGESFQNHLRGKAHKQMMDAVEETFQITVNILRENMRVVEEKKMIEFERMTRMSRGHQKHPKIEPQSHCNMCDLKFMGKLMGHRKTEGHQRLKRFLHPKCKHCNLEFPSRMEWIDHRFSPEHLRRLGEVLGNRNGQQDGADIVKEDDIEINIDPLLDESLQTEAVDPILELTDDLRDLHNRIPAYKPTRPVATASMTPISGFYCEVCDKFLTSEPVSQAHLRTEKHYFEFVAAAKRQFNKRKAEGDKTEADENKVKKVKTEETVEAEEEEEEENLEENVEENVEENGAAEDNEMYDPEEAGDAAAEDAAAEDTVPDTAAEDDAWAEVDEVLDKAESDIKEEEEKEEAQAAAEVAAEQKKTAAVKTTPRRAAAAPATPAPATPAKNGTAPPTPVARASKRKVK